MGVEEEYFIVDPRTRAAVPHAEAVVANVADWDGGSVGTEFTRQQIEARTAPFTSLGELAGQIRRMRRVAVAAARAEGLRVAATGTPILGDVIPPPIADVPRYRETTEMFRALQDGQNICACHVHVHVPDRATAILAGNHVRPWLPVLLSMTGNSPYLAGRDTGYASWRTLSWSGWPVAGPPPFFGSLGHFEDVVGTLLEAGALKDRRSIFWDVRPSAHLPTLEIRVADVASAYKETVLFAALVRALVVLGVQAVGEGDKGPRVPAELLRAAQWRAARDGIEGQGLDVRSGRLRPAVMLVDALLAHVRPLLEAWGEYDTVERLWGMLRADGSGAARQRADYARRGRLTDVVDGLIERSDPDPRPGEREHSGGEMVALTIDN
ncbi:carboxylate-amine ligase [Phytomonospora endophytica]|uniref:Putative glutamate--cysteine ligase 2 n=1 Tax=Phytomonospora endophytica TaxID=714109 RepID=A0A841FTK0_9ACTN|nr:glutamate--cysteine ligase [Phytomonospora endophytica]MBB6036657.1 carboxylate-amine ligase [Phytomonospora endophytica]GIG65979.1 putative glutamate--cysteine ligase 2 [Phytomonospora endophytica]